jgi:tripeptide aminopeptidase
MVDACTWGAGEHGCDVDAQVSEMFRGYRMDRRSTPVEIAAEALRRRGHEPSLIATGGGSDANALVAADYEAVLLANGTEANHTPEELVSAAAMIEMLEICEETIRVAASAKLEQGA